MPWCSEIPLAGAKARLIWDVLSPQDPVELCGQLGLCASTSALPLHTMLTEKVMQTLSELGVSGDPPSSALLLQIQTLCREILILYLIFSSTSTDPRWGMPYVG